MGNYKEEYKALHDYAQAVLKTNPGSTDNPDGKPLFIRFYICLEAYKRGWVDGCKKNNWT